MALISIIENFQPMNDERLLKKAVQLEPVLYHGTADPISSRRVLGSTFMEEETFPEKDAHIVLDRGDSLCLDFGTHLVGRVTLRFSSKGSHPDAPALLRLQFAETLRELREDPAEYNGWISSSWIQEETIHVDVLPAEIALPRRYAFRYLLLTVRDTSPKYKLVLEKARCRTETAADLGKVPGILGDDQKDPVLRRIREVSLRTLANCMQGVLEDGPKRDRRLWTGDLRLTALVDYASFRNFDMVKRCLYLFAGSRFPDGRISACLFVEPSIEADDTWLYDYSLLYVCALEEYLLEKDREGSPDTEALEDLYDIAMEQIRISLSMLGPDGIVRREAVDGVFIDWSEEMDKTACAQAVLLYTLPYAIRLAKRKSDLQAVEMLTRRREELHAVTRERFWSPERDCFISGQQAAIATQVWMILSGAADPDEARRIMLRAEDFIREVPMKTPYMHHYYVEALLRAGLKEKALGHIREYWGGMIEAGADTFWEAWDPENPDASPYGGCIVNSYCHAWSCTPLYLLDRDFNDQ